MTNEIYSISETVNTFICGDSRSELEKFPDRCVDMIITSPPYYNQRNYKNNNQIGTENNPEDYIANILTVIRECKRILKDTGTFWLNVGDKYSKGHLLGMPWRIAIKLQDEIGLILRSDIIWYKPNAMPSSVKNRPTTDHEYIFFFAKTKNYFYNADAIREPHITFTEKSLMKGGRNHFGKTNGTPENGKNKGNSNLHNGRWDQAFHPMGRNRRTIWEIPLSKFREAHFAVFPEKLVGLCILAGSKRNNIVFDPFMGSGTTALVAKRLKRRYIGIDSSQKYCDMAAKRMSGIQMSLGL